MFPWTPEELNEYLFLSAGGSFITLLQGWIEAGKGKQFSYETVDKLLTPGNIPRRKQFAEIGLGESYDLIRQLKEALEGNDQRYVIYFETVWSMADDYEQKNGHIAPFVPSEIIREKLPRLISGIFWTENFYLDNCPYIQEVKDRHSMVQPITDFPAKEWNLLRREVKRWDTKDKVTVFEIHAFMLYMALLELDLENWKNELVLLPVRDFLPAEIESLVRYPMWMFCTWLKDWYGVEAWEALGETIGEGGQQVRNWANSKSLDKCPSWTDFQTYIISGSGAPDSESYLYSKQAIELQIAYGMVRILQAHAMRCVPFLLKYFCDEGDLQAYYNQRIDELKEKECGVIPPHPEVHSWKE